MNLRKLLILVGIVSLAALIFFLPGQLIKIQSLDCVSQYGVCSGELDARLRSLQGKNLSRVVREAKQILSQNLLVRASTLQFKLPDRLLINVVLRKGRFALNKNGTSNFAIIDKDGTTLEINSSTNLPTVKIATDIPKVSEVAEEHLLFALNIAYDMFAFYPVKNARIVGDSLVIDVARSPTAIFPLEGDRDALVGSYKLLMSRLNKIAQESKIGSVSEIDLRFKNPVVR